MCKGAKIKKSLGKEHKKNAEVYVSVQAGEMRLGREAECGYEGIQRKGFPGGLSGKESICQCRKHKRCGFDPWVGKIPWRRKWQPSPVFLPGASRGQRSLGGYSPQGCKELDTIGVT